ncbi:TetR/AcrR family transcriptional regulator [Pseudoxanthomonas winnipegensis]|jgi:TetR/AcrR family transcriptional repressor of nem operon|uniref:TetR/AcrR family transcriptional regulator n=1 Tax=Pseudoxanthomonas winnipegensis TaxID=2480810 RepID=A0A4Q8LDC8_9GAMM|nr:TetR/AcrR family transcriptional regulator [Pseudoxanthomonas winnipegensis]TAA26731.1 TetR/AcrR family transcriptional regulator [Pseudoxanthomonas winnipegensis]
MSTNAREAILLAARDMAQAHGYSGLSYRELAAAVGIRAASIYHHFESKAELGAAVARRYWEDAAANLEAIDVEHKDPRDRLLHYPETFRGSLLNENRLCLASFMSAESLDLPELVMKEVRAFADVNIAWLANTLVQAGVVDVHVSQARASAIFAAIAGAQLLARSRSDLDLFDGLIQTYRQAGLIPG